MLLDCFQQTTNRHSERTREESGIDLQGQILREYAQDDVVHSGASDVQ